MFIYVITKKTRFLGKNSKYRLPICENYKKISNNEVNPISNMITVNYPILMIRI